MNVPDWRDCLERVMSGPGHKLDYRKLCADDHPRHEAWRARMCVKVGLMAAIEQAPAKQYPPLIQQARNAAGALGRVVTAVAKGATIRVSEEEHARRLAICQACEFHDAAKNRCTKCGCGGAKLHLATERCPLEPPKWNRWEDPNNAAVDSNHLGAEQVNIDSGSISTSPG